MSPAKKKTVRKPATRKRTAKSPRKKTVAKKPARKRKPATLGKLAPVVPPRAPKNYRARVRMYRHGLGDCFLITFPRARGAPFQMLIDCGALGRDNDFMSGIVGHLRDTVRDGNGKKKAHIDVVVATHEHKDHLSGFNQAREIWNDDFDFGAVWLGWTENLTKPEIRKIKTARRKALASLQAALASPLSQSAAFDGVPEILNFSTDEDTAGAGRIADALEYLKLRGTDAGNLEYLEPGTGPFELDGVSGVRVYVLGPPRDPILLKGSEVTQKHQAEGVIYHLSREGDAGLDALASAVPGAATEADDRFHPFAPEHRIAETIADPLNPRKRKKNPYYDMIVPFLKKTYLDPGKAWQKIEDDWLRGYGQLALDLDSDTNNTSVVLAFEFVKTREVLLFVGDAQVGNWQSWAGIKFDVPGQSKPMAAHDLLSRTVFYKVGHHCSHNATLKKGGLELMNSEDLVAFVPLDIATAHAQGKHGWDMPAGPLYKALMQKTGKRTVISDVTEKVSREATLAGVIETTTYIDYYLK